MGKVFDPHALTDRQVITVAELLSLTERAMDGRGLARTPDEQEAIEAFRREQARLLAARKEIG